MKRLVTEQFIRDNASGDGGWTKAQAHALGIKYPFKAGWIRRIVGTYVDEEALEAFAAAKGKLSPATIKMRSRQQAREQRQPCDAKSLQQRLDEALSRIETLESKLGKDQPETVPCLFCDTQMESAIENETCFQPYGGGEVRFSFCFGSTKFDDHAGGTNFTGYVCDECASKYVGKMAPEQPIFRG